jgi:ATP-dependent exoDNAse (exonuclease V) beta subunit
LNARAKTAAEEGEAVEVESPDGVTILTAHNSKGTEYPLVIVTGLETEGRKDSADPVLFFHDAAHARLGLKVPDAAHADGRLEPSAPYLVLKHLRENRNRAEEKRLAYVSLTRAQDHLMIAAPPITSRPKGVLAALVAFEPLRVTFADADSGDEVLSVGGVDVDVRRTFPEEADSIDGERPFTTFAETLSVRPEPAPTTDESEEFPPIHTATDFRDLLSSPGETIDRLRIGAWRSLGVRGHAGRKRTRSTDRRSAAELGTHVHELLSTVYVADDVAALSHIDDEALEHIRVFSDSAVGRAALAAGGGETEVEFVIPFGEDIFRGAIDRVFQDHRGVWTVVDYKTDDIHDVEDAGDHARGAGYDLQLALYALALRDCRALGADDEVRAVLVFTQPSEAGAREVEWTWRAADLPAWSLIEGAVAFVSAAAIEGAREGADEPTPLPAGDDPFARLEAMLRPPEPPSAGVQLRLY